MCRIHRIQAKYDKPLVVHWSWYASVILVEFYIVSLWLNVHNRRIHWDTISNCDATNPWTIQSGSSYRENSQDVNTASFSTQSVPQLVSFLTNPYPARVVLTGDEQRKFCFQFCFHEKQNMEQKKNDRRDNVFLSEFESGLSFLVKLSLQSLSFFVVNFQFFGVDLPFFIISLPHDSVTPA